jgi:hypothetical protein
MRVYPCDSEIAPVSRMTDRDGGSQCDYLVGVLASGVECETVDPKRTPF